MADVVVMPQLGNTVESCLVTAWHVGVGDTVEPDTVVAEIETDKSSMEVPSGQAGTVLALLAQAGDEVPVKAPFFIIGAPGESVEGLIPGGTAKGLAAGESAVLESTPSVSDAGSPSDDPVVGGVDTPVSGPDDPASAVSGADASSQPGAGEPPVSLPHAPLSPKARRLANATGLDASGLVGSGPGGRIVAADIRKALASIHAQPVSIPEPSVESDGSAAEVATPVQPSAVTGAAVEATQPTETTDGAKTDQSVDASPSAPMPAGGTGLGGRLTRQEAALAAVSTQSTASPQEAIVASAPLAGEPFPGPFSDQPLKGVRKLVAGRMLASMAAHAQLTFDASAPAAGLLALRARFKKADASWGMNAITIGDLVAYAAVQALRRHPSINATLTDAVLRTYDHVHLGLAVDTPRGLLVPTIRDASTMGLSQFSAQSKLLAAAATKGDINPDLLTGGTFTVTNLGAYGIESFTPILNSPQVGILGVNAIRPAVCANPDGSVGVEQRISFSLTVDHAVVDGADAAHYLQTLCGLIADIDLAVMGGSHA